MTAKTITESIQTYSRELTAQISASAVGLLDGLQALHRKRVGKSDDYMQGFTEGVDDAKEAIRDMLKPTAPEITPSCSGASKDGLRWYCGLAGCKGKHETHEELCAKGYEPPILWKADPNETDESVRARLANEREEGGPHQ